MHVTARSCAHAQFEILVGKSPGKHLLSAERSYYSKHIASEDIMPGDGNFKFAVLIAGLPVPEYYHDGKIYVESNLWTPVSYNQRVREMAYGEVGYRAS